MEDVCYYMGLNKACPKDPFLFPRIDQIVDSTSGCETLCFLDAYSEYHQIAMKESNQLAASFITPFGSLCYITMLFGLKNAGLCTSIVCSSVSGSSSGEPLRPTWMTSCQVQMGQPGRSRPRADLHKTPSKRHQTQPRDVRFRGPKGYAAGFYRL